MAELIANCPRCGAKGITFELRASNDIFSDTERRYLCEVFAVCRNCWLSTTFVLQVKDATMYAGSTNATLLGLKETVNRHVKILDYVNIIHMIESAPPEHVPDTIEAVFREASVCFSAKCYNAAGAMFRLCIDIATKTILVAIHTEEAISIGRYRLAKRLSNMFETGILPESLRDLSECVREDGNDGAHDGTLTIEDASDLMDFTTLLLERMFTEPERLRLAKERRDKRRESE